MVQFTHTSYLQEIERKFIAFARATEQLEGIVIVHGKHCFGFNGHGRVSELETMCFITVTKNI